MPTNDDVDGFRPLRPVPMGWVLRPLLALDAARPGLLAFLHAASDLRRQGMYYILSRLDVERPENLALRLIRALGSGEDLRPATNPLSIVAEAIVRVRVKDLLLALDDGVAPGLLASLARVGPDPLDRDTYERLRALHADPALRARALLLRAVPVVTDERVGVVLALPEGMVAPEALGLVRRPADVALLEDAVALVRRLHPGLDDERLRASVAALGPTAGLDAWVRKWAERSADLPPRLPHRGTAEVVPLRSGAEVREIALRYRNCLRDQVVAVALGRVVYYEHRPDAGGLGAIAEVAALSGGRWILRGIHGAKNRQPPAGSVRALRAALEGAGVAVALPSSQPARAARLASALHQWDYDGGRNLGHGDGVVEAGLDDLEDDAAAPEAAAREDGVDEAGTVEADGYEGVLANLRAELDAISDEERRAA